MYFSSWTSSVHTTCICLWLLLIIREKAMIVENQGLKMPYPSKCVKVDTHAPRMDELFCIRAHLDRATNRVNLSRNHLYNSTSKRKVNILIIQSGYCSVFFLIVHFSHCCLTISDSLSINHPKTYSNAIINPISNRVWFMKSVWYVLAIPISFGMRGE